MDKSGANYAGIENINLLMLLAGWIDFLCRNMPGQIFKQYHRAKPSVHQENHQTDDGLQGLPVRTSNARRNRKRTYDPKKTVVR